MKRKYYLRGLGLGILVTALVFIFIGPKELSDEEIIKRAEKLGYVKEENSSLGIKDLLNKETPVPTKSVNTDKNSEITHTPVPTPTELPESSPSPTLEPTPTVTPEPTEEPTPTATPTPTEEPTPTVTVEPTEEPTPTVTVEPTEKPTPTAALAPTEEPVPTVTPEPTEEPTPTVTVMPTEGLTPTVTPAPTVESSTEPANEQKEVVKATIVIERGYTAKTVCGILEAAGIIQSAEELRDYLTDNNLTEKIIAETYHLSSDMSLEEIVKRLTDYYNYN